jgi:3-oxoadipate enol-lactonase
MTIVDVGTGPPIVIVPGVQGRWEWMRPAVDALARGCRVITFSFADEPTCGGRFDEDAGFASYVDQIGDAMENRGVTTAAICGVSYGGLVAAAFATRYPDRTSSLILVSALPPTWTPDARVRFFLRAPVLLSPLFCIASLRLHREIAAASSSVLQGIRASITHGWNAATHLFSPSRMARRVRLLASLNLPGELTAVRCPVLIVTGEERLDRVVPVRRTREYSTVWPHARVATIARTGHLGLITRPDAFANVVVPFVQETVGGRTPRRRVG